jgi:RNA polymerase sigma-70 factor (ECF subfamily)
VDAQPASNPQPEQSPAATPAADRLRRARGGDLEAFRELLRAHQGRVFSMALRFTGSRADAEELLQDVFLQMHGALAQITSEEHLKHWLLRAVSHRCIDRLRQQGRRPKLVPLHAMPESSEPQAVSGDPDPIASARLRELLLDLAPDARAVILLRFQQELELAEIATALDIPLSTVKSHLRRSLDRLRAQLTGDEHGN